MRQLTLTETIHIAGGQTVELTAIATLTGGLLSYGAASYFNPTLPIWALAGGLSGAGYGMTENAMSNNLILNTTVGLAVGVLIGSTTTGLAFLAGGYLAGSTAYSYFSK